MTAERVDLLDKQIQSSIDGDISRAKMTRSAGVVAIFTTLSRVTGLLRDKLVAHLFGATAITDAFVVAFTIPNMMRRFVAEGALTVAFIPVYTDLRKRGTEEDAREFFRATLGLLSIFLIFLVIIGVLASSYLVYGFASGFEKDAAKFALTTSLTQLMFPYVFCISLVGLFMGALNSRGHFAIPAASPVVLNISMMGGAYFCRHLFEEPIMGQALGVIIGGVLQLIIHIPALRRYDLLQWPTFNYHLPSVVRLGRLLIPALFGVAAYQFNLVILRQIGSYLPNGQLTCYYNADRLMQLALGIFAISIATAALPTMSAQIVRNNTQQLPFWPSIRQFINFIRSWSGIALVVLLTPAAVNLWRNGDYLWFSWIVLFFFLSWMEGASPSQKSSPLARGDIKEMLETWSFSTRLTNFITIPAAVGLFIVAVPIASVLWFSGEYKWDAVELTAYTAMAFAPGLVAIAMMRTTVQVFYALEDMKTPVKISAWCMLLNLGFGLALLRFEVVGLALAFTLSSFAQMALLLFWLRKKIGPIGAKSLLRATLMQMFSATLACALAYGITLLGDWNKGPTLMNAAILMAGIFAAIISYTSLAHYFGSQESRKIWMLLRERVAGKPNR